MNYYCTIITGDTHGAVKPRIEKILKQYNTVDPENLKVIILGDASVNYTLDKNDWLNKKAISSLGISIYCVRGNHEERPENLGYELIYDDYVDGEVYVDKDFPLIRYFKDGGIYNINGYSVLVMGGAYSVDKYYRLARAKASNSSFSGWFKDEQLTEEEMNEIYENVKGKHFDFVFSHTCPYSWEPTDLFLSCIDQDSVDTSMEKWLDKLKNNIDFRVWCFGHFHEDRIELPRVEQFYYDCIPLEEIDYYWNHVFVDLLKGKKIEYDYRKWSPKMIKIMEE